MAFCSLSSLLTCFDVSQWFDDFLEISSQEALGESQYVWCWVNIGIEHVLYVCPEVPRWHPGIFLGVAKADSKKGSGEVVPNVGGGRQEIARMEPMHIYTMYLWSLSFSLFFSICQAVHQPMRFNEASENPSCRITPPQTQRGF